MSQLGDAEMEKLGLFWKAFKPLLPPGKKAIQNLCNKPKGAAPPGPGEPPPLKLPALGLPRGAPRGFPTSTLARKL